jgi:hypothetical protein
MAKFAVTLHEAFYHVGNNDLQGFRESVGNPEQKCD